MISEPRVIVIFFLQDEAQFQKDIEAKAAKYVAEYEQV
jgi:hypothetical protein